MNDLLREALFSWISRYIRLSEVSGGYDHIIIKGSQNLFRV